MDIFILSTIYAILSLQNMQTGMRKRAYEALLIGKQIKYFRHVKEMSQIKLAYKVGVTRGWIGNIEQGLYLPNIKLLFKIAGALGVQVKDLIPF